MATDRHNRVGHLHSRYRSAVSYTAYDAPSVSSPSVTPTQGPLTQQLTLTATVSDPASSAAPTIYQWQQYTEAAWQEIPGATTATYQYSFSGTAGTYQFRLAATGVGGTAYSDAVTYTAYNAPAFSTATVTPQTGPYPLQVTYTAEASDTTSYTWEMSANSGGSWDQISTTATGQYTHQTAGTYQWKVTATGPGGTTTSSIITVTVTTPPPVFSTVSVSPTQGPLTQQWTLTAQASDTETYQWQSAPQGTDSWTNIATGASATYTYPDGTEPGPYQIRTTSQYLRKPAESQHSLLCRQPCRTQTVCSGSTVPTAAAAGRISPAQPRPPQRGHREPSEPIRYACRQ